jgi:Glutamine cyclotransferase
MTLKPSPRVFSITTDFFTKHGWLGLFIAAPGRTRNRQGGAEIKLPDTYFAEGLTLWRDRLIQLTWTSGIAFVYDLKTFERVGSFPYAGEGGG